MLIVFGVLLFADAVGSILLPQNHHDFWFDIERVARAILSIVMIVYGVFYVKFFRGDANSGRHSTTF